LLLQRYERHTLAAQLRDLVETLDAAPPRHLTARRSRP